MKLDPTVLRTMSKEDFRVLEAVEKGMKDHALVPLPLTSSIANLRHGGAHKIVSSLLRDKLLSHERTKNGYDGYRVTNAGYDILALQNLKARKIVAALGQRIGTGKESDVYLAVDLSGQQIVLKFHRLGRTSFRNVKKKRDYFGNAAQQAHSWLFLSKLSALKEFAFMKALYDVQYSTPVPIAHNRHIVAMGLVRGVPLYQVFPKQLSAEQAADIYEQAIALAARLAKHGLVHCDLNEFNLLVDLSGIQSLATSGDDPYIRHSGMSVAGEKSLGALSKPAWEQSLEEGDKIAEVLPEPIARLDNGDPKPVVTLIDFPQMISTKHPNAQELYERDLACLRRFFELKIQCTIPDDVGTEVVWERVKQLSFETADERDASIRLDVELKASGSGDILNRELELYYFNTGSMEISAALQEVSDEGEDNSVWEESSGRRYSGELVLDIPEAATDTAAIGGSDDYDGQEEYSMYTASQSVECSSHQKQSREELEEIARVRVRRQLDEQRRRSRTRGAFRKRNSNKTYVKGKRIVSETI
jgi:RIO kinase 2